MTLAVIALAFALPPAVLYARNVFLFRPPPPPAADPPAVSVLVPARNEEAGIFAAVSAVLATRGAVVECVVLDDQSTDRTAEIVREMARKDGRVRLESAPPLPPGWAGKQHACFALAALARYDLMLFLDADVILTADAVARTAAFRAAAGADLVSGFPRQITETPVEKLLIPLMHFVLLGFLPFDGMRKSARPGFAAGCGQLFLTTRVAYRESGGHGHPAVRASFHDGVKLPRAYRGRGLHTDVCDASGIAACRMYRNAGQVWFGLAKNAREGLAAPRLIFWVSVMLVCGQVIPALVLCAAIFTPAGPDVVAAAAGATACGFAMRVHATWQYRQSWFGAVLHPVGVIILLAVQWFAALQFARGRPVGWKGRPRPGLSS